jgi:competence protein ComFC
LPWPTVRSLTSLARSLLDPVLELIYPTYCGGGCGRQGDALCPVCTAAFIYLDSALICPTCGRLLGKAAVCGRCVTHPQFFRWGFYGYSFEGPLREALHAFKFEGRKDVGRALVHGLAGRIADLSDDFDVLVPLPVTEKRLKKRGFNQSFIISEEISKLTGRPIEYSTLRKVRETLDQFALSREERRRNIKGAFASRGGAGQIKGMRVLLVDDLYTTGSTASEACKALLPLKPTEILFFALARTPE